LWGLKSGESVKAVVNVGLTYIDIALMLAIIMSGWNRISHPIKHLKQRFGFETSTL
jgi:hypothetical protein